MRDIRKAWHYKGTRYQLFLRWWGWYRLRSVLNIMRRWFWGGRVYYSEGVRLELKTYANGNSFCYCGGSINSLRLEFLGAGLWVQLSRDRVARPCVCEKVVWCVLPEDYRDEIEDYGEGRLRAEFPHLFTREAS